MKIKSRLTLSLVFFAIALFIIAGLVIYTNQQVDGLNKQEDLAKKIETEANELSYLSSDYILYRESQQADRWESKYSALASDLSNLTVDTPEQKELVNSLQENQQRLRDVFDEVKSGIGSSPQGDLSIDTAMVQVYWSRLAVQTQGIVFDASRLSNLLRDEADQVKRVTNFLIFLLMGTFSLFILTSYLLVYRRTLTSITKLQDGVKVIGSGDLGHVIPEKGDDEIRDLSRGFNQMTAHLKEVTASRADLEREVAERKKAEEEVRKSEERYHNLFSRMTEGFALHEIVCNADNIPVDYRFLEINPAFEKLTALQRNNVVGRLVSEVLPGIGQEWIETFGKVALTGIPVRFDNYSAVLNRHYDVYAFSPALRQFAALFSDITDRKRAEEELRRSHKRTSAILESLSDSFIALDKNWRITYINRRALAAVNVPSEEVLGKTIWDVFPSIVGTPLESFYREAMASQKPLTFTNTSVVITGKQFELHTYPMEDGLTIFGQDVTEREQAEEALRESEAVLRSFFDSSGVMRGIVEVIAEDDVRHITDNKATAAFIGLTPEVMKNKTASELGEPRDIMRMWVSRYIQSQKTGKPVEFEYQERRGGAEAWLRATVSYLGTHSNGYPRFAYVVHDITEHKQVEEALHESEERLMLALRHAPVSVAIQDRDLVFRWVYNQRTIQSEDVVGRTDTDFFEPEDAAYLTELKRRVIETGTAIHEQLWLARSGKPLFLDMYLEPLRDADGRITGIGIAAIDQTEQKQAEEKIERLLAEVRKEKDRLSALINSISDEIWFADTKKRFTLANPSALLEFGLIHGDDIDVGTLAGRLEVLRPDGTTRPVEEAPPLRALSGEVVRNQEEIIRTPDRNELRYRQVSSTPVRDDNGIIIGSVSVVRDITDLKRSEEKLRDASQYLENLIDYANAPIIVWDPDFTITRFNHAFERLTGRQASEVIGQHIGLLFPEKFTGTAMDIIRRTTRGERLEVVEIPILHKSGEVRTVLWNSATLFDADGRTILSTIAQGQDITERKRAEERLAQRNRELLSLNEELIATQTQLQTILDDSIRSEQELRRTSLYLENLINYANAPIVVWDPRFVITRFNRAFEELTGRTAREIIGQRLEVLFPQQYLESSMEIIRRTMKGERLRVVEIPILNRSGEIKIVIWNSATLFEDDGKTIQSTIAQGNDITERKMAEAELEERNRELSDAIDELTRQRYEMNEALKEREVLLSEIHHRVKNNLTAFISLLSLKGTYDETPAGIALKKDLQNRARSMALIHETLYRTGKYSQVDMRAYLTPLIHQIAQSYDPSSVVRTEVDTGDATLDLTRATPCGLIITELITNSFKYAFPSSFDCRKVRSEPCTISVSMKRDGDEQYLTVSDNGIGLPPGLDIGKVQSLGLRLVYFLAKHQLRAGIDIRTDAGTAITLRFRDKNEHA